MALRTRMAVKINGEYHEIVKGFTFLDKKRYRLTEGFEKNAGSWYRIFTPIVIIEPEPGTSFINPIHIKDELGFDSSYNPPVVVEVYITGSSVVRTRDFNTGPLYGVDTKGLHPDSELTIFVNGVLSGVGGKGGDGADGNQPVYTTIGGVDQYEGYPGEDGIPAARLTIPTEIVGTGDVYGACGGGGGAHTRYSGTSSWDIAMGGGGGGGGAPAGSYGKRGAFSGFSQEEPPKAGEIGGYPWKGDQDGGDGGEGELLTNGDEGEQGAQGRGFGTTDLASGTYQGNMGGNVAPFLIEEDGSVDTSSFEGTIHDPTA